MNLLWILGAFVVFVVVIRSVHATDDYASARYGYAPFAMPNLLFMLIPNGLLLFALQNGGQQTQILIILAGAATLGMLVLVCSRTNGWIALFAAPMLLFCAPVLVFSILFRGLARADRGGEN
jgi:hypothetical protein